MDARSYERHLGLWSVRNVVIPKLTVSDRGSSLCYWEHRGGLWCNGSIKAKVSQARCSGCAGVFHLTTTVRSLPKVSHFVFIFWGKAKQSCVDACGGGLWITRCNFLEAQRRGAEETSMPSAALCAGLGFPLDSPKYPNSPRAAQPPDCAPAAPAGESWAGPQCCQPGGCRRGVLLWVCENGGPSNGGALCPLHCHSALCSPLIGCQDCEGREGFPPPIRP